MVLLPDDDICANVICPSLSIANTPLSKPEDGKVFASLEDIKGAFIAPTDGDGVDTILLDVKGFGNDKYWVSVLV